MIRVCTTKLLKIEELWRKPEFFFSFENRAAFIFSSEKKNLRLARVSPLCVKGYVCKRGRAKDFPPLRKYKKSPIFEREENCLLLLHLLQKSAFYARMVRVLVIHVGQ